LEYWSIAPHHPTLQFPIVFFHASSQSHSAFPRSSPWIGTRPSLPQTRAWATQTDGSGGAARASQRMFGIPRQPSYRALPCRRGNSISRVARHSAGERRYRRRSAKSAPRDWSHHVPARDRHRLGEINLRSGRSSRTAYSEGRTRVVSSFRTSCRKRKCRGHRRRAKKDSRNAVVQNSALGAIAASCGRLRYSITFNNTCRRFFVCGLT